MIKNHDLMVKIKDNCKKSKHNELIKELDKECDSLNEYNAFWIEDRLEKYMDLLTGKEISNYLVYAVCDEVLDKAESGLALYLKDPSSYLRYDYGIYTYAHEEKSGLYYVAVKLEYGARNSFNAMVKGTKTMYVYYTVKDNKIEYNKTELSAYDKWQLSR